MRRLFLASSLAVSMLVACSPADAPVPEASSTGPVLSYTNAFVMEPIGSPDVTMGGISLSVEGGDVHLVSATSDAAGTIEMHTMSMADGKMQMRPVPEGFAIADGETLELKRGGNHFMLYNVTDAVRSGETVDITLNFDADGEPMNLVVEAEVKAVGE